MSIIMDMGLQLKEKISQFYCNGEICLIKWDIGIRYAAIIPSYIMHTSFNKESKWHFGPYCQKIKENCFHPSFHNSLLISGIYRIHIILLDLFFPWFIFYTLAIMGFIALATIVGMFAEDERYFK